MKFNRLSPQSHHFFWLAPVAVLCIFFLFVNYVNLEPKITPDFFFSSDSEIYKQNQKIQEQFPFRQQILLNITTNNIDDPNYIQKISNLTTRLQSVKGIKDVQSITNGPDDLQAARQNPLWKRLLIGNNEKSTFVIAFVSTDDFAPLVQKIEKIVTEEQNQWFDIRISGLPYIVEKIRRNLMQDMKVFTIGAIALSALMLFTIFRSFLLVIGAVITCVTAAMLTLVIQGFMGISIGILTANLGTIVFVLTLSHIIFLISNWCNAAQKNKEAKLRETLSHTFPASFWAAVTTLLGFFSLIFVEAKPLNELGIGGTIGTVSALLCAYLIFPAFLHLSKINPTKFTYALAKKFPLPKKLSFYLTCTAIFLALIIGVFGISRINTDPSLLTYFKKDTDLYNGIYEIDKNGGSNPLLLVVKRKDGGTLDNNFAYDQMWELQKDLSAHSSVGSVISLPVIMAEGDENWLGSLLPWNILLDILSKPRFGQVAKSFISEDRKKALFILRMKENDRNQDRLSIIKEISKIPAEHGFTLVNTGGTYFLQGQLATSVAQSMTTGIITLIVLFGVIAFIVSGSFIISLSVVTCAACVSALVLGTLGLFSIPIDIISSPAINICLGLIVDDMIHLTVTTKRYIKQTPKASIHEWAVWKKSLDTQSWPAIISTLTIIIGFSVFALSDFPPSQRFGLEIVFGAFIALILALGVFPFLVTQKFGVFKKTKI